jgi:hypothetical protein
MSAKLKSFENTQADMNGKISTLFTYREKDRENFDQKIESVLSAVSRNK